MELEDRIEKLARAMCEAIDVDPDQSVGHGYGYNFKPRVIRDNESGIAPAVLLYSPRWRYHAWDAEKWIFENTGGEFHDG